MPGSQWANENMKENKVLVHLEKNQKLKKKYQQKKLL